MPRLHKLNKKRKILLILAVMMAAIVVYCHFDTQALPNAVDIASGIVGDRVILSVEKAYYGVSGWVNERVYSAKLALGVEKPHSLRVDAVPVSSGTVESGKRKAESVGTRGPAELARNVPLSGIVEGGQRIAESMGGRGSTEPGKDLREDGEGEWIDKGSYLRTFVYPEPKLDSIADIVMFKPGATDIHLVCGTMEPFPGGTGRIPDEDRKSVVMAFSGGFKYRHDGGGMALDGKLLRPMKKGLGTLVLFRDGGTKIGKWGRDWAAISSQMRDLRQGFMLVDKGAFCDNPMFNVYSQDKETYVRRSAIGVTDRGALVYATGNDLSADGLARAMIAVGVVSAVSLEMNMSRVLCGVPKYEDGKLRFVALTPRCCDPRNLVGTRERDFMYVTKRESPRESASAGIPRN